MTTLDKDVYNISWVNYVPIPQINKFSPYSYSRVRWLIHENKIPSNKLLKICNLTFIRLDFIKTLNLMANDPDKYKKQKFMVDKYYETHEWKKTNSKQSTLNNPSS